MKEKVAHHWAVKIVVLGMTWGGLSHDGKIYGQKKPLSALVSAAHNVWAAMGEDRVGGAGVRNPFSKTVGEFKPQICGQDTPKVNGVVGLYRTVCT